MTTKRTSLVKGSFHSDGFAIFEYREEMFTKLVNKNIYIDCLVSFFSSVDAEQNGERILKIGRKLRKLYAFKQSCYKV